MRSHAMFLHIEKKNCKTLVYLGRYVLMLLRDRSVLLQFSTDLGQWSDGFFC